MVNILHAIPHLLSWTKPFIILKEKIQKYVLTEIATSTQQFHTARNTRLILLCTDNIGRMFLVAGYCLKNRAFKIRK
jgi:hypothetical protein